MKTLHFKNLNEFKAIIGESLPESDWIKVTQDMINDFANATLDTQWVHVDVERAKKESPYQSTIAHGFMSLAFLSKMIGDLIQIDSVKMGLNYGLNKVRFPHPVPVNSRLRIKSSVLKMEEQVGGLKITFSCTVEIEGYEKPACVAEFLTILFE